MWCQLTIDLAGTAAGSPNAAEPKPVGFEGDGIFVLLGICLCSQPEP